MNAGKAEVRAVIERACERRRANGRRTDPASWTRSTASTRPSRTRCSRGRGGARLADRRDDREPVLRGQLGAALPLPDLRASPAPADDRRASCAARSSTRSAASRIRPRRADAPAPRDSRGRRRPDGADRARARARGRAGGRSPGRGRRRRGRAPAQGAPLRRRRRPALRLHLGLDQGDPRLRRRRVPLLPRGDARGRRGPALHRPPDGDPGLGGHRQRRPAGARWSRPLRCGGGPRRAAGVPAEPGTGVGLPCARAEVERFDDRHLGGQRHVREHGAKLAAGLPAGRALPGRQAPRPRGGLRVPARRAGRCRGPAARTTEELQGERFYAPTDRGFEAELRARGSRRSGGAVRRVGRPTKPELAATTSDALSASSGRLPDRGLGPRTQSAAEVATRSRFVPGAGARTEQSVTLVGARSAPATHRLDLKRRGSAARDARVHCAGVDGGARSSTRRPASWSAPSRRSRRSELEGIAADDRRAPAVLGASSSRPTAAATCRQAADVLVEGARRDRGAAHAASRESRSTRELHDGAAAHRRPPALVRGKRPRTLADEKIPSPAALPEDEAQLLLLRADRGRRRDRALELPVVDSLWRSGDRADGGQRRGPQAREPDPAARRAHPARPSRRPACQRASSAWFTVGAQSARLAPRRSSPERSSSPARSRSAEASARSVPRELKGSVLELGGKDLVIVCADADLADVVSGTDPGGFANAGQTCSGIEGRVYVVEEIADRYLEGTRPARPSGSPSATRLSWHDRDRADGFRRPGRPRSPSSSTTRWQPAAERLTGGPEEIEGFSGPLHRPHRAHRGHTRDADHARGDLALVVADHRRRLRAAGTPSSRTTRTSASACPSVPRDRPKGERMARQIESGMVWINDHLFLVMAPASAPGGVKESGIGRSHSKFGFYECVNVKTIIWEPGVTRDTPGGSPTTKPSAMP